jgi:hypothetical protein
MVLLGYDCALAICAVAGRAEALAAKRRNSRRETFMSILLTSTPYLGLRRATLIPCLIETLIGSGNTL